MKKQVRKETKSSKHLNDDNLLLDVSNLSVLFKMQGTYFKAVNNISFKVNKGDFFGIVGESGSGKSTTGKSIVRLAIPSGGKISFDGKIISNKKIKKANKKFLQNNIQMIFQDPMASLNYSKNILQLISEPLIINKTIRKKSFILKRNFDLISEYYWFDFLKEYTFLYRGFVLKYWNNLIKAYQETVDSNLVNDNFNNAIDSLVDNYWKASNVIEEYVNQRDKLFDQYIEKANQPNHDNIFYQYHQLVKEIKDIKKAMKISPENLGLNSSDTIKKYNKEFKELKNTFFLSGRELLKNWKLELNNALKVKKQEVSLTKNYISHVYNYVDWMELKIQKEFCKYLIKNTSHLKSDEVLKITKEVETICINIFADIAKKVFDYANKFSQVSPSFKSKEIDLLTDEKAHSMSIYIFVKNFLSKKNNYIHDQHTTSFLKNNKNEPLISEERLKYIQEFLEECIALSEKNSLKFKEVEKEFNEKKSNLKNIYKQNLVNFKSNQSISNELLNKSQSKSKLLSKFKKQIREIKFNQKCYLNKELDSNQYFKELRRLKNEKKILEEIFIKKYHNYLKKISKNPNNPNSLKKEKLNLKKKWKYYLNNVNVLNSFKNFSVRESYYYKFAHLFKGPLKILFIPLFRNNEKRRYVYNALESVGLKKEHAYRYPHEFSGGQRQRIVIARALITNPKLVIADEPISALDVSIQAQVINIMKRLAKEKGVTFLFIAHDLSMVNHVCNKLIIMHRGKILEGGEVDQVFKNPVHPYTQSLMKAVPKLSRIHVDLASFEENHTYDLDYSLINIPKYFDIKPNNKHYIFGTEHQVKEWVSKS